MATIDTRAPSATIVVTPNPVTYSNNRLVTVTITFDEAVTGFTVANIDFSNAHITPWITNPIGALNRSADGRTYTITYMAAPDIEDATNTISLRNLDTIRDAANNAATVSPTSGNYVIDTKTPAPTSITIDKERFTVGDTATVTITFNEIVNGFTVAAIQIANGSVSNLTQDTTDGRIWRATFTPTANLDRTSFNRLAVNLDGLTDGVGNASNGTYVSYNPNPIVIDTKPPEVAVTISDNRLTAGETATITFTFTERVTGFGTEDIQYDTSKGTLGALTAVGTDGKVWTATYTPQPGSESVENTIRVNLSGVQDAQGNAGVGTGTSGNFSIDTKPTEVAVTISDNHLTAGETATITFTFSERVTGFDLNDVQYDTSKGTLGALTAVGTDGRVWTATYTPQPGSESAENTIRVNLSGVQDAQGNAGVGTGTSGNFSIDTKPSSATIVVTPNPVTSSNDRLVTVVITFDEAVTGFTVANIDFNNAHVTLWGNNRIGALNRSTDGRTYTITYTAEPDTEDATNTISLRNLDTIRDAVNNAATVSPTSNNYVIDTKDPVPTSITLDKERITAGETATVTVTFNEIVSGFTAAAIQIANGSVSNLTQDTTDGRIWRATFTPTANLDRTSFTRLAVDLDGITDRVGNASNGTYVIDNPTPIVIDTKPPEVAVTISDNRLAVGETATITFTFSERVTGFDLNDVQYDTSKGTLGALTAVGTDGRVWTATYTPQPGSESAENTIRVNLSGVQDAQGNAGVGTGTSGNFSIDTKPPSATIVVTPNPVTASNDRLVTVTITFDEAVTGFTVDNIEFSNAHVTLWGNNRIGALNRSADGRTYTITYTAEPDTEDATNTISLRNLDTIRDAVNNAATVSPTSNNYVIDTKDPVPTSITLDKERITAGETATVTVTFNEIVSGFTAAAIQIANGSVSNLTQDTTDGRIWRATFTPTANLDRTSFTRLAVDLDGITDRVGNASNGTYVIDNPTPIVIDTKPPEVAVTISDNRLAVGETATITFTFSERVTGFDLNDVQYDTSKGTLGALTAVGTDGRVWTATYTPQPGSESAENTIRVNLSGVQDAQGNAGVGTGTSGNFSIDTKPSSATIVVTPNPVTSSNDRLVTVVITFDEAVTGFTVANIDFNNAHVTLWGNNRIGALNRSTDGRTYTITYTAEPDTEDATNTISLRNLDTIRDAVNNAATVSPTSNNYVIDTKDPVPTSITLDKERITAGETATVTVTFNEIVSGFTAAAIQIANGSVSNLTQDTTDGRIWRATFTPTANLDRTSFTRLAVDLDGITDRVGNASNGTYVIDNPTPIVIDTKPPEVAVTISDNHLAVGETATITFTFSERVTGFDLNDVQYDTSKGTLGALTAVGTDGRVWTATYTPQPGSESAENTIRVNLSGVQDAQGNAGVGTGTSGNFSIDTKPPSATIVVTPNPVTASNDRLVTVVITFDEAVTGFTVANIDFNNAHVTRYGINPVGELNRSADGRTYTITYTAAPDTEDATNTISLRLLDTIRDAAGNAVTVNPTSGNFEIDTKDPVPTSITLDKERITAGETATVTVTFNEIVSGFTAAAIQIANGSVSNLTQDTTDGRIWRATFTPTANLDRTSFTRLAVDLDGITDRVGNASNGTYVIDNPTPIVIDTKPPEVAVTISDNRLAVGETATITFTFSERVTGFDLNDVQYDTSKGTLGALTAVGTDGRVWTATYTPQPGSESAENTIRVNLSGVQDAQGNAGVGTGTSGNFSIDTKPPEVAVTISDNRLAAGETATITFTFNERVTGFDLNDVQYDTSKGTLGALTAVGTDGRVWSASYTPRPDTESAENTIRVNLSGVQDAQGNAGVGTGTSDNFSIDTKPPEVAVTISDNRLAAGETATITFTFTERVTGFTKEAIDMSQANGTLGDLVPVGTDGKVWSASYTPRPDTESANNTIRVNLSGVRDALGNAGVGTPPSSGNFSIDTQRPTVNVTISDNRLIAGETATVTFTFSETVTGFTKEAIDMSQANGTLGDLVPVGTDGKVWTATFTPTANLARTTNNRLTLANVRDAAGNAFANNTYSFNQYTVDTMVFALSNATVNRDQLVLSYGDETALDGNADHAPTNESFTVLVDGTRIDVSRVTVDAAARTVTLTLARAVTAGQQVTVAYQDTDTSDGKALQEAGTGDDAASFAARAVTNLARSPVAPATPDAPSGPDALDSDRDGLFNNQEDLATGLLRPDGSAGMEGDGNGDGVKDSQQAAVASNRDQTLVAGSQDGKVIPGSNARINELVRNDAPANLPKGMEMPIGLTSFKVGLSEGRGTESFSLYVDPALGANGYWLKNSAGTWVNLASEPYGGKVASEGGRTRLDFQIEDGGQYDADGQVNGSISAPGAAARMPLSLVGQTPDGHSFGFWY
ncbi:glycosyl hydrolase [Verminephrobacter eiseniae]|uniref:Ig-like domain-containing protein n=1 Tax=Verminephrobacter eiseniae TaxID=364317 RepID=UPI002AA2A42C|nr:Ig-like domain-containing protein [Verminephrobacter eiseniae]MCW5236724.1 glycosyl hydrolase [Verminephrobacter eiseniae]